MPCHHIVISYYDTIYYHYIISIMISDFVSYVLNSIWCSSFILLFHFSFYSFYYDLLCYLRALPGPLEPSQGFGWRLARNGGFGWAEPPKIFQGGAGGCRGGLEARGYPKEATRSEDEKKSGSP